MKNVLEKTIGQIVAEDFRAAEVFKNHHIDFCCTGYRTLEQACKQKPQNLQQLVKELYVIDEHGRDRSCDFNSWPLDLLTDYIEKKHHRYVEKKIPVLKISLNELCKVHGNEHPELFKINEEFNASASDLSAHMKKEELILFPSIRKMLNMRRTGSTIEKTYFGSVKNPVQKMMAEHEVEGERFRQIKTLSNNYTPPEDACNTYRLTFSLLQEFENELHQHVHLENNILFTKAMKMEKEANI